MARRFGNSVTAQITPSSGVAKTVWQIKADAGTGIAVMPPRVAFDGTSTTAAKAVVEIVKGATGGTGSSNTPVRTRGTTGSLTATVKENFSAEPTGGNTIWSEKVHTQSAWQYPRGEILLDPGETLGIRVTIPAAVPVNACAEHEE